MSNWESWEGVIGFERKLIRQPLQWPSNAWNNEQAKKSVNRCMYMVISTPKKKTFIIKFPSKLKKSWPTLNIGVPIIEYIDLLDEPKKKRKVIIGTSLIIVLIPTSPLHLSFPFQKENSNLTTPSNKNQLEPTLSRTS